MDLAISVLIAMGIGIIPIKKIFTDIFFHPTDISMNYYEFKKCYAVWKYRSYFLPVLDFLKAPALYYILNLLELQSYLLLAISIIIVLWLINPLNDLFYGRGMSIFLGVFLVVNIEIFKIIALIYVSLLLLSRYQAVGSFLTGIAVIPMLIYGMEHSLFELILVILFSCTVIYSYKSSFYQILNKRFFHIFS